MLKNSSILLDIFSPTPSNFLAFKECYKIRLIRWIHLFNLEYTLVSDLSFNFESYYESNYSTLVIFLVKMFEEIFPFSLHAVCNVSLA